MSWRISAPQLVRQPGTTSARAASASSRAGRCASLHSRSGNVVRLRGGGRVDDVMIGRCSLVAREDGSSGGQHGANSLPHERSGTSLTCQAPRAGWFRRCTRLAGPHSRRARGAHLHRRDSARQPPYSLDDAQLMASPDLVLRFHDAVAGTPLCCGAETVCHADLVGRSRRSFQGHSQRVRWPKRWGRVTSAVAQTHGAARQSDQTVNHRAPTIRLRCSWAPRMG